MMKKIVLIAALLAGSAASASLSDGVLYKDDFSSSENWIYVFAAGVWDDLYPTSVGSYEFSHYLGSTSEECCLQIDGVVECFPEKNNTAYTAEGSIDGLGCRVVELTLSIESTDERVEVTDDLLDCSQIILATGTTNEYGKVKLYIYSASGENGAAAWSALDESHWVDDGSTNTLRAVFLYGKTEDAPDTFQLTINDDYVGVFTNVVQAATEAESKVASIVFEGSTTIESLSCADLFRLFTSSDSISDTTDYDIAGLRVAYTNLTAVWGIELDTTGAVSSSTTIDSELAKRLVTGLVASDAETAFFVQSLSSTADGKMSVKVPCDYDHCQEYRVTLYGTDGSALATVTAEAGDLVDGAREIFFALPTELDTGSLPKTILFTVQAYAPGT